MQISPNQEKKILLVLALVNFTNILDFVIISPMNPIFSKVFDINTKEFGLIVSCYAISAGVSGFLSAFITDKYDRKKLLIFTYSGFLIGTLACGLVQGYWLFLISRCITGIFGGILGGLVLAIVSDVIPFERRATGTAVISMAFSAASVLGVPLGLYLAQEFNWHIPFLVIVVMGVGVWVLIYMFIPNVNEHLKQEKRNNPFKALTDILQNNNQLLALLMMVLLMFGQFSVVPFLSDYMVSNVGLLEGQLPLVYLFGGLATIVSAIVVGKLADKYGKQYIFMIFCVLGIAPILIITNLPPSPAWLVLMITTLFFVVINGRIIPAMAMNTSAALPQQRGSFMSISSCVQQFALGGASLLAGAITQKNELKQLVHYEYVGYVAVVASILCLIVASRVKSVETTSSK